VLSFDDPLGAPPDVRLVLSELRGHVLSGCAIAYTGVVSEHMNESSLPLSTLVVDFGGTVVPSVDEATHLVARQKPGWKQSAKLRRGKQRLQVLEFRARQFFCSTVLLRSARFFRTLIDSSLTSENYRYLVLMRIVESLSPY